MSICVFETCNVVGYILQIYVQKIYLPAQLCLSYARPVRLTQLRPSMLYTGHVTRRARSVDCQFLFWLSELAGL